jgi:hypothetical protein
MLRLLRLRRAGRCRRCGRRGRRRGRRRCGRAGGRRARTLCVAVREMRRHCRAGDVDRVRLPRAGVVTDVDLLLSLAFSGRGGQLCRRRATRRAGRLTHGAGRLTGRRCRRLILIVCLRRSRAGRRRGGGRRLRGDLGEADSCGCRERQPDGGYDERTAPESAESVPHDAFPSLGFWAYPPQSPSEGETCGAPLPLG